MDRADDLFSAAEPVSAAGRRSTAPKNRTPNGSGQSYTQPGRYVVRVRMDNGQLVVCEPGDLRR